MLKKLLIALTLIFAMGFVASLHADYLVNFDGTGEVKTAYASGTVNLSGLDWNLGETLIGTETAELLGGIRTARLRGYGISSMSMLANKANGLGTLTFSYRRYATDAQVDWQAEYSTDDGTSWAPIGAAFTAPATTDIQTFSEIVNVTGNVRIRIKRATETGVINRRLNIDNINLTDFTGVPTPTIIASGTLNAFSTFTGTPSAAQTYNLSGSALTANIVVNAPPGYEISSNGSTYSESLSLATSFNGPIYVRLIGTTAGNFSGNIVHTSTGAAQVDKAVTGTVTNPAPMIYATGILNAFSTLVGTPSVAQSYTLYGEFLTADIIITPPTGFQISTNGGTTYASSGSVLPTFNGLIYVRLAGTTAGSFSGDITHTSTGATQVNKAVSGTVNPPVTAQVLFEENFDYTAATLLTANGWTAHSSGGSSPVIVGNVGLTFPSYPSQGGLCAQTVLAGSAEDVHRSFTAQTSGSFYASFLFNASEANATAGDYVFHMSPATISTDFKGRFFVQKDASNNLRFGITKAGTATSAVWTDYLYPMNTTVLVLIKYVIVAEPANDQVYLWINPNFSGAEPAPQLTASDVTGVDIGNIGSVAIRQGTTTPIAKIDGIRVSNDWNIHWQSQQLNPVIHATGDFGPFLAVAGVPSDAQFYNLHGDDLTSNIFIDAPDGFEVATNNQGPWTNTLSVSSSFNGTVYVRLGTLPAGFYGGAIVHTSGSAVAVNLHVEGEVFPPEGIINVTQNLQPFTAIAGTPSATQTYALSGTNLYGDIILTTASPFQISVGGQNNWQTGLILPFNFNGNIDVRMNAASIGVYSATITHASDGATSVAINVSGTATSGGAATNLFFSEYVEGGSNRKAVEIFNGTGAAVNLANFSIKKQVNGAGLFGSELLLTGTLANNDVYVIVYSAATGSLLGEPYVDLATTSGAMTFNGNDCVALYHNGVQIDVIGIVNQVENWGIDVTLVRYPNVTAPRVDFTFSEWTSYPVDTLTYLGWHTFNPGGSYAATPTFAPAPGTYYAPINVTISTTTPNATIRYTTDGSDPSPTLGTIYTNPVAVNTTTTIKAIAYADGFLPSSIGAATYSFPIFVSTIAQLRAQPTGTNVYRLTGEAVLTFKQTTRNQKFVQDATAAILIDDVGGIITTNYNLYDGITGITGTLTTYSNLLQFVPTLNTGAATSVNNVIVPEGRTLASLTSADQSKLIKVLNVSIDATNVNFGTIAENIDATDPTATLVLRTFPATNYSGTPIPVNPVNLVCIVGQFGTTMQVSPRFLADFEATSGGLPSPVLTINQSAGLISVTWNAVVGATSYIIQASNSPYSGFVTVATISQTQYAAPATEMKFFRVIAVQ
ncbi:MAG: chitobiase/beta-hexosaminidase C-terminal domain-containing protein [Candidatus Cloacimonadaceae bacterium]|nr:chitobiase/beta-hexosaminidase C-terminal domain-containing protein [Candidatus Cloacimonadaceae bacterium]MDP3113668.1 chitobiase/beta-hexosaminidase C-terminal domain-containing protein [Candidatus Cloacimonadaceae bacterium]